MTAYQAVHCGVLFGGFYFLLVGQHNKAYSSNPRTGDNLKEISPTVMFSISPAQFQRVIKWRRVCHPKEIISNTAFKHVN